uniref:Reelin domain-containing protein n=1 Tax=Plectus sambesii TaxID=2011161 RepID=A0A914X625_9BILA
MAGRWSSLLLISLFAVVSANPNGAPCSQLDTMTPQHRGGVFDRPSPFKIDLSAPCYRDGQIITVTLRAKAKDGEEKFKGFVVQPRATCEDNAGEPKRVGKFLSNDNADANWKFQCDDDATSVTHTWNDLKEKITFDWVPPQDFDGELRFVGTVVKEYSTFWVQKVVSRPLRKCNTPVPKCESANQHGFNDNDDDADTDAAQTSDSDGASDS